MSGTERQFAWLNDERLAEHALSPDPAWLWSPDGSRMLWANAVAAAVFDCTTPAAASALRFEPKHPAATQIARLAATLPAGGAPRLERLRGFGARFGGTLMCMCSRFATHHDEAAILVVAIERAGKELALPERAQRLLADLAQPATMFNVDGALMASKAETRARLGASHDLSALGADELAREAMVNGKAEGEIAAGKVIMLKLGAERTVALLMVFTQAPAPHAAMPEAQSEPVVNNAPPVAPNPAATEKHARRLPLRFVWQMDAENRFTLGRDDFARLIDPQAAAVLDRPWAEIAQALSLDPQGRVAAALAAQATWSGILVDWPVVNEAQPLPIEMSGLPVFDRERKFAGFRGFAICRDVERLEALERRRSAPSPQPPPAPEPPPAAEKPTEQPGEEEAAKVLPFPTTPALSPNEHSAFQELARELGERLKKPPPSPEPNIFGPDPFVASAPPQPMQLTQPPRTARNGNAARDTGEGRPILDRLPIGILVYRLNNLIYANRAFLDWSGYPSLDALAEAGGLDSLFIESKDGAGEERQGGKTLTISTVDDGERAVQGRLFSVAWNGENALVLMINTQPAVDEKQGKAAELSLRRAEAEKRELDTILDTATDGVLVLDRAGRILSGNRSAQALFSYDAHDIAELSLGDLFAPESRYPLLDHLDRLARNGGPESFDAGREAIGLERNGGLVPLHITMGRIVDGEKFCAVLRDITAWKRNEEELIAAKQEAEKASIAKSELLAKISHEIRTPLNAIIGFSEVMMDERFGPVGNERYRQYLKDIHGAGGHLIGLVNDLLDLSKIEAGKLELSFDSVNLNDLVQQCVAVMQDEANRERVIIRTSLPVLLPSIVADTRSVRQIALNVLSNSIRVAGAGGQVILSTALTDDHEVVLRVRDTGHGMGEKELESALEPFQHLATSPRWGGGSSLALPITKALAEANHARFRITSRVDDGTLVEVAFPATRVLAQ
ncbi:MAG: histidine kinase dimerization/phospho-acceptor domain-containing protein [Pseudolabrys sp.]